MPCPTAKQISLMIVRPLAAAFALMLTGCVIPFPFSYDRGVLTAMEGNRLVEVREREEGWKVDLIGPCPKYRKISSQFTAYKISYDLSDRGAAPARSAAMAINDRLDIGFRPKSDQSVRMLRSKVGLLAWLDLNANDDPQIESVSASDLSEEELASLRRLGFTPREDTFSSSEKLWRWRGPNGPEYLRKTDTDVRMFRPHMDRVTQRPIATPLPTTHAPIWDPQCCRVAVVGRDDFSASAREVTVWDYDVDEVRTIRLGQ
jgi:hypothetical protein